MCTHFEVDCLNPYEFIRKYRCRSCKAVMMCACDESFGRSFLPHQLDQGTVLETQEPIVVTHGFQEGTCRACRGLPEETHPKAPLYGSSGKVVRYYWREIYFETTRRYAAWCEQQGFQEGQRPPEHDTKKRQEIEREVVEEMKRLHVVSPKYRFKEESQEDVIRDCNVEVLRLNGHHIPTEKRVGILLNGTPVTPEQFAAAHFKGLEYEVMELESRPFHVLFGSYTWLLFQDPADDLGRVVGFGDRRSVDDKLARPMVHTILPQDFGTPGYAVRRAAAIEEHFKTIPPITDELLWLFDYWLEHSDGFRNYLWAHRQDDIQRARKLIEILLPEVIIRILRYLVGDYWRRYLGWPDLLAHRVREILFLEVKSSKDKLSENQKTWIKGNTSQLKLPFKIVKIHRKTL